MSQLFSSLLYTWEPPINFSPRGHNPISPSRNTPQFPANTPTCRNQHVESNRKPKPNLSSTPPKTHYPRIAGTNTKVHHPNRSTSENVPTSLGIKPQQTPSGKSLHPSSIPTSDPPHSSDQKRNPPPSDKNKVHRQEHLLRKHLRHQPASREYTVSANSS